MKKTMNEEILEMMHGIIEMMMTNNQREMDKIENTMDVMINVIDNDDVWAYSVGDVTADELYAKAKEFIGEGNYLSHDLFMNVLVDWMLHLGKEEQL